MSGPTPAGEETGTPPDQVTVIPPGAASLGGQPAGGEPGPEGEGRPEAIEQPAKVMRIAAMVRQLLDEIRQAPLDEASRARMRDIHETSLRELSGVLSSDLRDELKRLTLPLEETPSEAELRIAQAQLVGWLEGLFHGIQAMLFAQQMETRALFEEMRRRSLPAPEDQSGQAADPHGRPGTYL